MAVRIEMWCWRKIEKISCADRVKEVLLEVKGERKIIQTRTRRKDNWIGYILLRNYPLKYVIEGNIEGKP
jgi:hypothetical protein